MAEQNAINLPTQFVLGETDSGYRWLAGEVIYRMVLAIGGMPNATQKSIAHGIVGFDRLVPPAWGLAIENAGSGGNIGGVQAPVAASADINMLIDSTNFNITTQIDYSGYDGWAFFHYLKI